LISLPGLLADPLTEPGAPRDTNSAFSCRDFVMRLLPPSLVLALLALFGLLHPLQAAERVVNIYGWSDYIAPNVLEAFTRETGIKVVYDTYDSNKTLETKLIAGNTNYDVVVPSGTFLEREIEAGLYRPLDKSKLPHMSGLWPTLMNHLAAYDPGNRYAVDYMWFTTGLAYNVGKARERLGNVPRISLRLR
jgi:putrescine transport system substrate-binding protein